MFGRINPRATQTGSCDQIVMGYRDSAGSPELIQPSCRRQLPADGEVHTGLRPSFARSNLLLFSCSLFVFYLLYRRAVIRDLGKSSPADAIIERKPAWRTFCTRDARSFVRGDKKEAALFPYKIARMNKGCRRGKGGCACCATVRLA